MDVVELVVGILISWGIITVFNIAYGAWKRSTILGHYRFTGDHPSDDERARQLTTVPLNSDIRISHLWPAMSANERSAWHRLMREHEHQQQTQDKEEAELSGHDRSTERGEEEFLRASKRLENHRQYLFKKQPEEINFLISRVRERLDDEARVSRYLSDRALFSSEQAKRNSERATGILMSKYIRFKRSLT